MSEMVERVAKRIAVLRMCEQQGNHVPCVSCRNMRGANDDVGCITLARSVVEEMREPTAEMKQVGFERAGDPCWQEDVGWIWRGMIDEVLGRNALAKGELNYRPIDEALK